MVSVNRSFVYGICFASITWTISLYLVYQLHRIDVKNINNPTFNLSKTYVNGRFKNSEDLIRKLQPVKKHVSLEEKEQGLSMLGMVRSAEDQHVRDEGYRIHAFNTLISNRLPLNRTIPDTRNNLCRNIQYPISTLPTASIVICFYNEHLTTLLRSIASVLFQTPAQLLHEVILVDDHSDLYDLGADLQRQLDVLFNERGADKIRLVRNAKREGLIRSRVAGSRKANGDVLVFLDSHIEVNVGWLEPLLLRIKENRTRVAIPIIDIINADTFAYTASPLVRGGFNWGLHFKWESLPKGTLSTAEDFIQPIKSPTMAGGLFAMERKYFVEIGEYDEGMDVWGGENLEISFRVWMCGGSLELLPCSRVGHVFRARRPYGDPEDPRQPGGRHDSMTRNSLRVAHVWMDEYKQHYISHLKSELRKTPGTRADLSYGDISSRVHLRNSVLHCKPFSWYLRTVYPEQVVPGTQGALQQHPQPQLEPAQFQPWHSRKREYIWHGLLRIVSSHDSGVGVGWCAEGDRQKRGKGSGLKLAKCAKARGKEVKNQTWWATSRGELVLAQLLCLQTGNGAQPHLHKCHELGGDQQWQYNNDSTTNNNNLKTPIYNLAAGRCLGVQGSLKLGATVGLTLCHNDKADLEENAGVTAWEMLAIQ